ncbi:MAG TPA: DUF2017 family protein [Acidimicrobiia bacterium]|jgi:hypothetical protein
MARRYQWFTRRRDGVVTVRLRPDEAALLVQVGNELRALLDSGDGAVIERLFPKAYLDPTEEGREREYAALVHADLMRSRLDRLAEVLATIEPLTQATKPQTIALDDDAVQEWLAVLNDARLALGVAVGITEDLEPDDVDEDDPRRLGIEVYQLLTWFFGELVEVALAATPESGHD